MGLTRGFLKDTLGREAMIAVQAQLVHPGIQVTAGFIRKGGVGLPGREGWDQQNRGRGETKGESGWHGASWGV
jgi:hypothetical protein